MRPLLRLLRRVFGGEDREEAPVSRAVPAEALSPAEHPSAAEAPALETGELPKGSGVAVLIPPGGAMPQGEGASAAPASGGMPESVRGPELAGGIPPGSAEGRGFSGRETLAEKAWGQGRTLASGETLRLAGPPVDLERELSETLRFRRRMSSTAREFGEEVL